MNKKLTLITLLCLFSSVSWSQTEINDEDKQMMKLFRSVNFPLNIEAMANIMKASNKSLTKLVCQVPKEVRISSNGISETGKLPDEIIVFAYNEEFLAVNSPIDGPNTWVGLQIKTPAWGMVDIWGDKRFNTDDTPGLGVSSIYNDIIIKFSIEREHNPEDITWENGVKVVSESLSYTVNRVTNEIQFYQKNDLLMQNPILKDPLITTIGNGDCTISDTPF